MLQFLIDEEVEYVEKLGPCLLELTDQKLGIASCLTSLAEADQPPGLRAAVLIWYNSLLRRVKSMPIQEIALYKPIQKLLLLCNHNRASPNEKEEVELLLTLCGLVRKQPELVNLFLSSNYEEEFCPLSLKSNLKEKPKHNPLFDFDYVPVSLKHVSLVSQPNITIENKKISKTENECNPSNSTDCSPSHNDTEDKIDERFLLMDLLITYLSSADNHIVLRACEGIMIITSFPNDKIAYLITNNSSMCSYIIDKLIDKFKALPEDTDPCDIDQLNITWGFANQEFVDKCVNTIGLRETTSFLSWLDYCDTLAKECHGFISTQLAKALRWHFFVAELELGLQSDHNAPLITTVIGKCLKAIDSPELLNEISQWLVGDCVNVALRPPTPIMQTLLSNCLVGDAEVCLETLRLFEIMLEKASEHILYCLIFAFLENRGYHAPLRQSYHPEDDERDRLNGQSLRQERESNRQTMKKMLEGQLDGSLSQTYDMTDSTNPQNQGANIHHAINSFLLLLPRNLLSDPGGLGYEQYMQDAHRHYLRWVEATAGFNWPTRAVFSDPSSSSTQSCDSRPEADLHLYCSPHTSDGKSKCNDTLEKHNNPLVNSNISSRSDIGDFKKKCNPDIHCNDVFQSHDLTNMLESDISHTFHQQLVLSNRDRCSISEMAEDDELTFDEGPFLRTLFKLLSNMPNQPYHINLQLTAIISKLAMMPHPYLHEYLLNPSLPTGKNVITLFKILQKLSKSFMSQIPKVKRFNSIIDETRQRLLGDDSSDDSDKSEPLFESLIVVEEFCKELAAIYFVKYHHSCS